MAFKRASRPANELLPLLSLAVFLLSLYRIAVNLVRLAYHLTVLVIQLGRLAAVAIAGRRPVNPTSDNGL